PRTPSRVAAPGSAPSLLTKLCVKSSRRRDSRSSVAQRRRRSIGSSKRGRRLDRGCGEGPLRWTFFVSCHASRYRGGRVIGVMRYAYIEVVVTHGNGQVQWSRRVRRQL